MKHCFLLAAFLAFSDGAFSQPSFPKKIADSLWGAWTDENNPSIYRCQAIHKYAWDGYLNSYPDSAFHYAQLEFNFAKKNGLKSQQALALNTLGVSFAIQGQNATALEYYKLCQQMHEEIADSLYSGGVLANIGNMYFAQGDYTRAEDCYLKCLQYKEKVRDKKGSAGVLLNLGNLCFRREEFQNALEYYNTALLISRENNDKKAIAVSIENLGNVCAKQRDYISASKYFGESLDIRREIGDKKGMSNTMNNIGLLYFEKGDSLTKKLNRADALESYSEAVKWGTKALSLAIESGAKTEYNKALKSLYVSNIRLDNDSASLSYLSLLKNSRLQDLNANYVSLSEQEKVRYFETLEEDFGRYYDFTAMHPDQFPNLADTAYNLALQNKGLALKSSATMRVVLQNSGDTSIIHEYENWTALKRRISILYARGVATAELEHEANELERDLVKKSTSFSDFDQINSIDWKKIQTLLQPGECAIEFVNFKSDFSPDNPIVYAAFLVKPSSEHPEIIRLCTESELIQILGISHDNDHDYVVEVYGANESTQKALYSKIWHPIQEHLNGIRTIYYSPTGLLHKISFSAISRPVSTGSESVFLGDDYHFKQMSSTGIIALHSNITTSSSDSFFLMGGVNYSTDSTDYEIWSYLPGTLIETDNINSCLLKKEHTVNYFSSDNATEENFKSQIIDAEIVHIATHGYFFRDPEQIQEEMKVGDESKHALNFRGTSNYANWSFVNNKNPLMRSGIILANANDVWERDALAEGEDGVVTALEVSHLDLHKVKLVVLSACETGLGDIKGSEGVYGLQRAFKMAGVKYIIMSLWQVPDKETAEFMTTFYKHLTKMNEIRAAFDLTQKEMRKKYDPYYWGAFVLIE